jgi:predicted MFS family arabinose efflux permease
MVGAGEAGGTPAMSSILSDLYPPERRARVIAIFYAGNPLGAILAFLVGGWIAAHWGWRATFIAAGLPGICLAVILLCAVREPQRRRDTGLVETQATPGLAEILRTVRRHPSLRLILMTPILTSAATAGVFSFAAPLLLRTQGLSLSQAGLSLAVFYGALGTMGTVACGQLVDRLARRDTRWLPLFCTLANVVAALTVPIMALSSSLAGMMLGLGLFAVATTATYGPVLAMLQSLARARMRGAITAIFYFNSYLIGAGSGPWIVGSVSDLLQAGAGQDSLRYGILLMALLYVLGAMLFWLACRSFRNDLVNIMSEGEKS